MSDGNGMDVIAPAAHGVQFKGRVVEIRPLTVGQIPGVMRALKGIDLASGFNMADVPALLADHGDALIGAVSIAAKLDRAEVESAEADEFLQLIAAVVEVNTDFFVHRLAPTIERVGSRVSEKVMTGAGRTLSSP